MARPNHHLTDQRRHLTMPRDLDARVEAWRCHQPDAPPRAEAIRRLIERGLAAVPMERTPAPERDAGL